MAKKSAVAKAGRGPATTPAAETSTASRLSRLLSAMDGPIDTSDIPEVTKSLPRIRRDASGRLEKGREGPVRTAILAELGRQNMTRYELWQKARVICGSLPSSAVYEYLRGRREIGLPYAEAMMLAIGLVVSRPTEPVASGPDVSSK